MNRYEDATEDFYEMFLDILENKFPSIQYLKFKLLFDNKRRINKGKLALATVELANEKIKFFSKDKIAVDGYDYIVTADKKAWELSGKDDRSRIIRHELNHVFVDEQDKCKLVGHEIEDFYTELEANADDPEWRRRLAILVNDVYDQEKDMAKATKTGG
jgi:hypothetical protein